MCTGLESDPDYIGHGSMNRSGCYNNNNKFYSVKEWMDDGHIDMLRSRWVAVCRHLLTLLEEQAGRQADPRGLILVSCSPGWWCYIGCLEE